MPDDKNKVQIWPSNKIKFAYLASNYYKKVGTLGTSCMRNKENQKALNFYVKNNVKIAVIVTKANKIKARALLWENVNKDNTKKTYTYLDRVYYSEEKQKDIYLQFAKDNKFLYYPKDKHYLYIKEINLDNITYLPYADTFNTLYYEDKVLLRNEGCCNITLKLKGTKLSLCNLNNGGYVPKLDKNATQEVFTKIWMSKKDCIKIKKYKGYVGKESIIDINGAYYSIHDNKNISKIKDGYCLEKNIVEEYATKDKIDKTKAVLVKKYGDYVCKDNIVYVNKILYSKQDKVITQIKDKYYLISNTYKSIVLDKYILKDKAIIAYRLGFVKQRNLLDYREEIPEFIGPYYIDNSCPCIILNTGEYIIKDGLNMKYLIRRNKKYYLRYLYRFNDSKQLKLPFLEI